MIKIVIAIIMLFIFYYFLGVPFVIPSLSRSLGPCTQDLSSYENMITRKLKDFYSCKAPLGWTRLEEPHVIQ